MSAKATQTVSLSSTELESAIGVLSSAQALHLTRFERLSYRALMVSVDLAVLSFVAAFFFAVLALPLKDPEVLAAKRSFALYLVSSLVGAVSSLVGIVSLVLNIPLFRKALRERARLKQLGLSSLSESLWKESRRSRWISRARSALLIVIGILILAGAVGFIGSLTWSDAADRPAMIFTTLFLATIATLLLSARYLRNQRERMDLTASAEELRKALESLRRRAGDAGVVSVPVELLEQTAKIESTQIAKERKDAILQSVAIRRTGYTIAFDRDATEQRAKLGVEDRVELEDLVAQLSTGAQLESQAGAVAGAKGATLRDTTKSKRIEVEYVIDHASRGIRINAVRHRGEGSYTSLNGASHA
jgi:hypothetical protein